MGCAEPARTGWTRAPEDSLKKRGKAAFSIVKAVKANARRRVGSPAPERVLPDPKQKAARQPKHKQTMEALLAAAQAEP